MSSDSQMVKWQYFAFQKECPLYYQCFPLHFCVPFLDPSGKVVCQMQLNSCLKNRLGPDSIHKVAPVTLKQLLIPCFCKISF